MLAVMLVLAGASGVAAGVNGLPDAIHQAVFIGRVHVDSVQKAPGRYAQRAELTVLDQLRGNHEKTLSVLARDQGFSGVELSLVAGVEQLVFLKKEQDAWVLVEAFIITKAGILTLGDGSSTWWAMNPVPYQEARATLVKAIADDNRLPRTPLVPPRTGTRKDVDTPVPAPR